MIKERLARIQAAIARICHHLGRNPADITLVGVTKNAPVADIQQAILAGLQHIAENKVQEAQKKFPMIEAPAGKKVTRHVIGHLQTNKVKAALNVCDLIQSVDSLKLAQEIEKEAAKINRVADVLVQVNTSGEEQKFGLGPSEAMGFLEEAGRLEHVRILGLMTMAPFTEDEQVVRLCFRDLKKLWDEAAQRFSGHPRMAMKHLSMGMTHDYPIALEEGSNMIRVGRAIFSEEQG